MAVCVCACVSVCVVHAFAVKGLSSHALRNLYSSLFSPSRLVCGEWGWSGNGGGVVVMVVGRLGTISGRYDLKLD